MENTTENKTVGVKMLEIAAEQAGQRIDNFLLTRLKGAPKSLIYRILRKGEVRVNKGRIKPTYRLQAGDMVRIPPVRLDESQAQKPGERVLQRVEQSIIYEDKRLLVINKPSGLAVHGGSGLSYGIIEALRALRPDAPYLELVHRLDRETSGCLLIAKKRSALRLLHELLRGNQVDKQYLTLIRGDWGGGDRAIDAPLRKNTVRSGERMVIVSDDGKSARSLFRPLCCHAKASLMQIKLDTGRTHQIRVHALHSGHPIAGDEKYGDEAFNLKMRTYGLKRMFLHAARLTFTMPDDDQRFVVTAPLPSELDNVLKKLDLRYRLAT